MEKAQDARYSKINHLIQYLQGANNSGLVDTLMENAISTAFQVGRRISIDGKKIRIGKRDYQTYDIKKVTINTEGSMAIYDNNDKKICGTLWLNVGEKNIELFCAWVRRNSIQIEVRSGKKEQAFQYLVLCVAIFIIIAISLCGCANTRTNEKGTRAEACFLLYT